MPDECNHTSVGVVAFDDTGRILIFQRQKFPIFKAPCAGHVDELDGIPVGFGRAEEAAYRDAAVRELDEETGLRVHRDDLRLALTRRFDNQCRRSTVDGGPHWHLWYVYTATVHGQTPRGNRSESADLAWYTPDEALALPDLEPVWRTMLQQMK